MRRGEPEFFVGYLPVPPRLARFGRRWLATAAAAVALTAIALAAGQRRLGEGRYEFGVERTIEGVLRAEPVPALWVERPGRAAEGVSPVSIVPLAGVGKRGPAPEILAFAGRPVRLRGSWIQRGDLALFEVAAAEPAGQSGATALDLGAAGLGRLELRGEIVDSKCWLGVMKPGEGKSHKDCAIRCISGGAPAALVARDGAGGTLVLLLVGDDGRPLGRELLDLVGEPVLVAGEALRVGDLALFATDRGRIRRIGA